MTVAAASKAQMVAFVSVIGKVMHRTLAALQNKLHTMCCNQDNLAHLC
jgi:hypothetical protein